MNATILERRRERVRNLIQLAQEDNNPVKLWQGYAILQEINKRLYRAYSFDNLYSNLF